MKMDRRKLIYYCGFIGATIIFFSTFSTALVFRGVDGMSYSFFNQFISELGQVGISKLSQVFNLGLQIGGAFLALFMFELGIYLRGKVPYIAGIIGAVSMVGVMFVGMFPMNINFPLHTKAALLFFRGELVTILLFTLSILYGKQRILSKPLVIPGIISVLTFASFLCIHAIFNPYNVPMLGPLADRPVFYLQSFLEWVVFFSIFLWIASISLYLFTNARKTNCH